VRSALAGNVSHSIHLCHAHAPPQSPNPHTRAARTCRAVQLRARGVGGLGRVPHAGMVLPGRCRAVMRRHRRRRRRPQGRRLRQWHGHGRCCCGGGGCAAPAPAPAPASAVAPTPPAPASPAGQCHQPSSQARPPGHAPSRNPPSQQGPTAQAGQARQNSTKSAGGGSTRVGGASEAGRQLPTSFAADATRQATALWNQSASPRRQCAAERRARRSPATLPSHRRRRLLLLLPKRHAAHCLPRILGRLRPRPRPLPPRRHARPGVIVLLPASRRPRPGARPVRRGPPRGRRGHRGLPGAAARHVSGVEGVLWRRRRQRLVGHEVAQGGVSAVVGRLVRLLLCQVCRQGGG